MHSELVAVNVNGQLCQWKWSDPEPFHNKDVSEEKILTRILFQTDILMTLDRK